MRKNAGPLYIEMIESTDIKNSSRGSHSYFAQYICHCYLDQMSSKCGVTKVDYGQSMVPSGLRVKSKA